MDYNALPVNVSAGSEYKDKSGKLTMLNLRAELTWRMRDALDPDNGIDLALPDDPRIISDLCSVRYVPLAGGKVKAESKDDIKQRLGRSPDIGDTVLLAAYEVAIERAYVKQAHVPGRPIRPNIRTATRRI
jgi:hypothetical protein